MGGRGGAGATSGNRRGLTLPEITGSEKQVAWAKDIRDEFLNSAASIVRQAGGEIGLTNAHGNKISVEGAKSMQKALAEMFAKATDAKNIINFKQNARYPFDFLRNWAEQETRKLKK